MASAGEKGIEPLSDIFREVEEDVRRDRMEKLWKEYGAYVVGAGRAGVPGGRRLPGLGALSQTQREKDSTAFNAAQRIEDPNAAAKAFGDLSKTAGGGYAALARMEQANALAASRQTRRRGDHLQGPRRQRSEPHRLGGPAAGRLGPGRQRQARRFADACCSRCSMPAAPGNRRPRKFSPIAIIAPARRWSRASEFSQIVADPQASEALEKPRARLRRLPVHGRRQQFRHGAAACARPGAGHAARRHAGRPRRCGRAMSRFTGL